MAPSLNLISSKHDYFLVFSSHYNRDRGLDFGRLSLNSLSLGNKYDWIWMATSSIATKQKFGSFHQWGGLIPPQYYVPKIRNWVVGTVPIDMRNVRGVEGNFYKINPHEVITSQGTKRGDFGIHLDANAPGSLGCIVMSADRFEKFEIEMLRLAQQRIYQLPLFVYYS